MATARARLLPEQLAIGDEVEFESPPFVASDATERTDAGSTLLPPYVAPGSRGMIVEIVMRPWPVAERVTTGRFDAAMHDLEPHARVRFAYDQPGGKKGYSNPLTVLRGQLVRKVG